MKTAALLFLMCVGIANLAFAGIYAHQNDYAHATFDALIGYTNIAMMLYFAR